MAKFPIATDMNTVEIDSLAALGIRVATGPECGANGFAGRPINLVSPARDNGYAGYITYAVTGEVKGKEVILFVAQQKFWERDNELNAGSVNFFKFTTPSQTGRTSAVTATFTRPVKDLMVDDYKERLKVAAAVDMVERPQAGNKLEQKAQLDIPNL